MRRFALVLLAAFLAAPAHAGHYASLRSNEVYLREGPTFQHRVLFTYQRKDYPVEVLASYETWRRVRRYRRHHRLGRARRCSSDARTVLVIGRSRADVRDGPYAAASVIAKVEPGVVARLRACKPQFCEIVGHGLKGWIDRTRIWGVDAGEVID